MLDQAIIRRPGFSGGQHDVGRILDAMLYFRKVKLIVDIPLLLSLWDQLGPEGVRVLLRHPSIEAIVTPETAAIQKYSAGFEMLRPVFIRAQGDRSRLVPQDDLLGSILQWLGNQTKWDPPSRGQLMGVLSGAKVMPLPKLMPPTVEVSTAIADVLRSPNLMREFVRTWATDKGVRTDDTLLASMTCNVGISGDDLIVTSSPDLSRVLYGSSDPVSWSDVLGDVQDYVIESLIAARTEGAMVSSPQTSRIAVRHIESAAAAAVQKVAQIERFEEMVFREARVFGRAFNEGKLSFEDALKTVDETTRFREWLAEKPNDGNLLAEFHAEIVKAPRVDSLPLTAMRFSFLALFGLATDRIGVPMGLSPNQAFSMATGVSAIDEFLVSKLAKGWRPSTFVETVKRSLAISS